MSKNPINTYPSRSNIVFVMDKVMVTPLAAESFGARSMCTLVETPDVKVLLDAGISLCPFRFGYPPHPVEFQTIARLRQRIAKAADQAQVVTISHYHYDHHTPDHQDWLVNWTQSIQTARQIYQGKRVLMKNPKENINTNQRERAWTFEQTSGKYAKTLESADGKTFIFGADTMLRFSQAVFHGSTDSMLGWIIMVTIKYKKERFMFAPDIQGPMSQRTMELIMDEPPDMLMLGGPPFYLGGSKVTESQLLIATENLKKIVQTIPMTILEHHALRDSEWQTRVGPISKVASQAKHYLVTAAEYTGEGNLFLEYNRPQLFAQYPPSEDFKKWMRLDGFEQSHTQPPI
jgi:uncharacterized protein